MRRLELLKVGYTITLKRRQQNAFEEYKSKVLDINQHFIYIDYPTESKTNKTVFLPDRLLLDVFFVTDDDQAYTFQTEVIGREMLNIPKIKLKFPKKENIIKIQRRQFVRIEKAVDVAVHPLKGEFAPFTTITEDISAGGASILVPKDISFDIDQIISVWISLPMQNGQYYYLNFEARIVRVMEKNKVRNSVSIQFLDVKEKDVQKLIRFCFEAQVENKLKLMEK